MKDKENVKKHTQPCIKGTSISKEVDSPALANVQLHLERHIRIFQDPKTGFPDSSQNIIPEIAIQRMWSMENIWWKVEDPTRN